MQAFENKKLLPLAFASRIQILQNRVRDHVVGQLTKRIQVSRFLGKDLKREKSLENAFP
jgi:hypothetical protein